MAALYAYGIVPAPVDLGLAPPGIDEEPVSLETAGNLGAIVSVVDAETYAPDRVAERSSDVAWLGARAAAHDRVITWASDRTTIIPLPLFSLFRDRARIADLLIARAAELHELLSRLRGSREYTVRVFRVDAILAASLAQRSPAIADLEAHLVEATPGQRYLLERKLDQQRRVELSRIAEEVAAGSYAALTDVARAGVREPVPPQPGNASAHAVLNASFLVGDDALERFREAVTRLVDANRSLGFRFEFTGPWPPYHFVPRSSRAAGDGESAAGAGFLL